MTGKLATNARDMELTDVTSSEVTATRSLRPGEREYRPLTREWVEHSIPDRFMTQTARSPDYPAVKTREGVLTYEDLNRAANRVANAIPALMPGERKPVSFLLHHDANVPAAILGILKSGNFYFALDPNNPIERNKYLLEDSGAELIVTDNRNLSLAESLLADHRQLLNIDDLKRAGHDDDPDINVGPDHIAYLVYTSGSTGKPKGVVQTHRSVLHKTMRHINGCQLCSSDRVALLFSYNFGASASNLFSTLLTGASLRPFDIKANTTASLIDWLIEEEITFFHTVPTFFRHLVMAMTGEEKLPQLRLIRLAGETIYGNDVKLFQEYLGRDCILQVGMGSTETGTILQSFYSQDSDYPDGVISPGFPTEDMEVSVLTEAGDLAEVDEVGEITVRSRYMFSGYWNRPELSAKVREPAPEGSGYWRYRTRDLGCRLRDGRIMHLGRKDAQVKIRGHRVEMGEIELALLKVPGVSAAAIVATETDVGSKKLVAYLVRNSDASMPSDALRARLRESLPDYMIPGAFIDVAALPLTAGGKIDRANLSARPLPALDREITAPRDHIETQLLAIWEETLRVDGFGIRDDFFDLGGDSLLAMKMVLRIEEVFGQVISLANFSSEITIELLANAVASGETENLQKPILEIKGTGSAPPLFFMHGDYIGGGAYCRNLARHLDPDQPFYAIPPHGLDGRTIPDTIEEMAADRVAAIRAFQPDGPYRLGGFCWGGTIALEMAQQLKAQGADVEALVLIDNDPRNLGLRPLRRLIRRVASRFSLGADTELSWFTKCRRVAEGWRSAGNGAVAKSKYLLAKAASIDRVLATLFPDRKTANNDDGAKAIDGTDISEDRFSRWPTYHEIHQSYVAEPYDGHVVLFCSSRLQDRYPNDLKAGWRAISAHVETHAIDGDHWTCVTKYAEDVARKMNAYLSRRTQQ